MSVRFVIGRAGSGKTYHCLEGIRRRLSENPVDGPALILIVPEQASQQMERAILVPTNTPEAKAEMLAAHRADVLSFQRLAFRVLESAGGGARRVLSDPARAMVLRHLLRQHAGTLRYYRRQGRLGGVVQRLSATITELIQEGVAPDQIGAVRAQRPDVETVVGREPMQDAKLADLQTLYAAYLAYLELGYADPSQHLREARRRLPHCGWLHGAEIWVDGFASLSGEESATLVELARLASHTDVTLLLDPALADLDERPPTHPSRELFDKVLRTYSELHAQFVAAGLSVDAPLVFGGDTYESPRFRRQESLARLEKRWGVSTRFSADGKPPPPIGVELVELPSRRIEADFAAARICRWVQHDGYRYRDVAVIARDLEAHHDLLAAALESRGIPFFVDRRRPVSHHPLVELLRAAVAVMSEDFSLTSVRLLLKTGLLALDENDADELENYLLAHGIAGAAAWFGEEWGFAAPQYRADDEESVRRRETVAVRINTIRRRLLSLIQPWWDLGGATATHSGRAWIEGILRWFDHLGVGRTLARWSIEADADGRPDEADEHRQTWRGILSFLDDFAFAFADTALGVDEVGEILEAGLADLTLGLAPPTVDQVLIGAIERSRHPELKGVVLIGFNDGLFPQLPSEDSILNDEDRALLRGGGVRLAPPARDRIIDESMLAYVAFTRASESLVVTYATADENGKELRPSLYVPRLLEAVSGLTTTRIGDPGRGRAMWDVLGAPDLRRRLAMEFRVRGPVESDDPDLRGVWNELYGCTRQTLLNDPVSLRALQSLADRVPERLSDPVVRRLYGDTLRTSVSQLETYAACPFQHFSRHVLGLREREDASLEAIDVGRLHHAILEDFVSTLAEGKGSWGAMGEAEVIAGLGDSCARVAALLPTGGVLSDARNAYILRRTTEHLSRILQAQKRVAQSGQMRPRASELPFGMPQRGGLPALEIKTRKGRTVLLRGFIDRVDLAEIGDELVGIVVDYKSAQKTVYDVSAVYHGLSLQLPAYLLVLAEKGETLAGRQVRPVAALYVSLGSQYVKVDHPADASERELALAGTSRPRGFLSEDALSALDSEPTAGWSPYYNVRRNRDGDLVDRDRSDAVASDAFRRTLDHTRAKLAELSDHLLDGDVAARPFRLKNFSPCSWCSMRSVCRFEMGSCDVRFLDPLTRPEVYRRLTGSTAADQAEGPGDS